MGPVVVARVGPVVAVKVGETAELSPWWVQKSLPKGVIVVAKVSPGGDAMVGAKLLQRWASELAPKWVSEFSLKLELEWVPGWVPQ